MIILLILLSCVINQAESILIKKYNRKYDNGGLIFTSIVSLFSMSFFLFADIISDQTGLQFTSDIVIYGVIAGIFFALSSATAFVALGCGSFVLSRLILSYGVLIAIAQGLVLGESLSVFGWIGIAFVIVSLYLVNKSGNAGDSDVVPITKKWILMISMSVVFAGVFGIIERGQQRAFEHMFDNEFMTVALGTSAVLLFVIGVIRDGKDTGFILRHGYPYMIGAGLSNGATNFLVLLVYSMTSMSIVAPMKSGIEVVISFLVAKLLFKEKFSVRQYIGVIIGGIAVILFNI